MKQRTRLINLVMTMLIIIAVAGCQPGAPSDPRQAQQTKVSATRGGQLTAESAMGRLPLSFVENLGQVDRQVAYTTQQGGLTAYFTAGGLTMGLINAQTRSPRPDQFVAGLPVYPETVERWTVALDFVGAADAQAVGAQKTDAIVSYFRGQPDEWLTSIPTYAGVAYPAAWPGIDVTFDGAGRTLKSAYVIQPGADPGQIRLRYRGVTELRVSERGELEAVTGLGIVRESAPVAYQEVGEKRVLVDTAFELATDQDDSLYEYGFRVGQYDPRLPLVIDPSIVYSGYIGGTAGDIGYAIAVDSTGSAYVTGTTQPASGTFPVLVGPDLVANNSDAFVTKVKPDGTGLLYSGFIGGNNVEYGYGIAVDSAGNAYVTGSTTSSPAQGFPLLTGPMLTAFGNGDSFVTKVNPSGSGLVYSGYISGSGNDIGYGIAVDSAGSAYVTGYLIFSALNFPIVVGPSATFADTDVFVSKIKPDGSGFVYSGTFGGTGQEIGNGIAVDSAGSAYIVGSALASAAAGFPVAVGPDTTQNGSRDAFIAKVKADGTGFVYAGYVGGANDDQGRAIAVDSTGAAYITGDTSSPQTTFPVLVGPDLTQNTGPDAFVAKVRPDGTGLLYAGYVGGSNTDIGTGIAVDSAGNAYIVGTTNSSQANFPVKDGPDLTSNGQFDAFIVKVKADGTSLEYGGYVGGLGGENGYGIALDSAGNAYITGQTGSTQTTFPVLLGPDTTSNPDVDGLVLDAYVTKIDNLTATPTITPTQLPTATATATPVGIVCTPRPAVRVTTAAGATGVLNVTVQAGGGTISRIDFEAPRVLTNVAVSVTGGPANQSQAFTFTPSSGLATVQFTVSVQDRNLPTTVQMTITDSCGPWKTFVGGGPRSF